MKNILLSVSLFALEATAFWRLPCRGELVIDGIDPIMFPGVTDLSVGHMHTIQGGNAFNVNVTGIELRDESTCSSCQVIGDNSAYWTPQLYFQGSDGTFTEVGQDGGMLVYYLQRVGSGTIDDLVVFPDNFRMIAGESASRSFDVADVATSLWTDEMKTNQTRLRELAIGFNCLNYDEPANAALGLHVWPTGKRCPDGVRAEIFFPSCWNGKDVDSADHKSHMAYPSLVQDGDCPEGYPKRTMSLFYETIWNVDAFWGQDGQFVFSTGDPTGASSHGDFMMGWEPELLSSAMKTCTDPSGEVNSCELFSLRATSEMASCTVDPYISAQASGASKLPGCNPIQSGPAAATTPSTCSTYKASSTAAYGTLPTSATSAKQTASPKKTSTAASGVKPSDNLSLTLGINAASGASSVRDMAAASTASTASLNSYQSANADAQQPNVDPYLVIKTITELSTKPGSTITMDTTAVDMVTETVTGAPVYETVTAAAKHRRHMESHKRHARRGQF